jgi:hypothetical protein
VIAIGTRLSDFTTASKTAFQNPDVRFININVAEIDAFKHAALPLVADARAAVEALTRRLPGIASRRDYAHCIPQWKQRWEEETDRIYGLRHGPPISQGEVIGAVNGCRGRKTSCCAPRAACRATCTSCGARAAQRLPPRVRLLVHGLRDRGGLGVKMADPSREVYVMVGDGSFLMMSPRSRRPFRKATSSTSCARQSRLLEHRRTVASPSARAASARTTAARRRSGQLGRRARAAGFCALCRAGRARPRPGHEEVAALEAMREHPRTTAVVIEVDKEMRVPGYESWWDVPISEVSEIESIRKRARVREGGEEGAASSRSPRARRPRSEAADTGSTRITSAANGGVRCRAASEVLNPATGEVLALARGIEAEDDGRGGAASAAFPDWRAVPPAERIQYLFRFKHLLEEHFDEIARLITTENGKTLAESQGELRRGVENVEVACGIPLMMQGYNLEDVARGIDETMFRQPLGVVAAITPFNFPAMIPLWFLPYAIACGNTLILKPSERVPFSIMRLMELTGESRVAQGRREPGERRQAGAVDALLDHPDVQASASSARRRWPGYIYARAIGERQTSAVPGRREEPRGSAARCRSARPPRRSSPTARSAAPDSAVWRCR